MRNRDRQRITRDILEAALENSDGLKVSQISQRVDLTSSQARSYIEELVSKSFIEYRIFSKTYHTTSKGAKYLAALDKIDDMLPQTK